MALSFFLAHFRNSYGSLVPLSPKFKGVIGIAWLSSWKPHCDRPGANL